jgi:peptidoglycan/xylan/chitin deacetylase (PgdA/CDA1 family)
MMLSHKICFGSHTKTHARLADLSNTNLEEELRVSKDIMETKLGVDVVHFACPWGRTGIDYIPDIVLPVVKQIGYRSFSTTIRGSNKFKGDQYHLKRDHLLARWSNYQLRYFLSL